jgi:hypothetical protein
MSGEDLTRDLHGVPGAARGILPDEGQATVGEGRLDRLRLVPDHDGNGGGPRHFDGAEDVLEERDAEDGMEDLGPPALHPGALAGGQDDGLQGRRTHRISLAGHPSLMSLGRNSN